MGFGIHFCKSNWTSDFLSISTKLWMSSFTYRKSTNQVVQFFILSLIINVLFVFITMRKEIINFTHQSQKVGKMSVIVIAAIATVMVLSMHDKVLAVGNTGAENQDINSL
jgi:uncharacterized membrane protein